MTVTYQSKSEMMSLWDYNIHFYKQISFKIINKMC